MYVDDMTHVSRYPLDKTVEQEIFKKFWHSISGLRDSETVSIFFSDFLTQSETIMLAKRFTIAVLLIRGKRPKDIKNILHVSDSSTTTVAAWLKNAKPQTVKTLERIIRESRWEEFIDKLDAFLDELPPRYGTDWTRVGKERFQRKMERRSRASVR